VDLTGAPRRLGRGELDSEAELARLGSPKARRAFVRERRRSARHDGRRKALAAELASRAAVGLDPDQGILRAAPGALDGVDETIAAANGLIDRIGAEQLGAIRRKPMSKGFLTMPDLGLDSPYLRFALSDGVLGPVSEYLGLVPVLTYIDVWYSEHVPTEPYSSQLWHLDHADVKQVKVFLHCDAVDIASGPLTVLDAATSKLVAKRTRYTLAASRLSDDAVREAVGAAEGIPLTGPKGAATFVDTSRCFHFGSRVEPGAPPRKLVVFQYLTPFAFDFQHDHRDEAPFRELAEPGSAERDRLVLGAD